MSGIKRKQPEPKDSLQRIRACALRAFCETGDRLQQGINVVYTYITNMIKKQAVCGVTLNTAVAQKLQRAATDSVCINKAALRRKVRDSLLLSDGHELQDETLLHMIAIVLKDIQSVAAPKGFEVSFELGPDGSWMVISELQLQSPLPLADEDAEAEKKERLFLQSLESEQVPISVPVPVSVESTDLAIQPSSSSPAAAAAAVSKKKPRSKPLATTIINNNNMMSSWLTTRKKEEEEAGTELKRGKRLTADADPDYLNGSGSSSSGDWSTSEEEEEEDGRVVISV